jgi:hypothetical protein
MRVMMMMATMAMALKVMVSWLCSLSLSLCLVHRIFSVPVLKQGLERCGQGSSTDTEKVLHGELKGSLGRKG